MSEYGIENILRVWREKNKIETPVKEQPFLYMIDQIANLFSVGSFYYFILNFENLKVEMLNDGIQSVLGIEPKQYSIQELLKGMHPEDIEKMSEKENKVLDFFLNKISKEDRLNYKVVYLIRIKHADGNYRTILHQSTAVVITEDGQIQKSLVIHTDISYLNIPIDHKVSFIGHKRPSYYCEDGELETRPLKQNYKEKFSQREKEILRNISQGKDFNQIASELYISPHTVSTHRKNILRKAQCKNMPQLITRCIREGVI